MSGKYGSSQFSVFLADGFNLLAMKVQDAGLRTEIVQQQTDGCGDEWDEHTPTGHRRGLLRQSGGFFDDTVNGAHLALRAMPNVARIVCVAMMGNVIGRFFTGLQGAYAQQYEVLGQLQQLTKANVEYGVTGKVEEGVILQEWATRGVDWNTAAAGNSVDHGASSANGGTGYLQVSGFSGPNAIAIKIQHAADGGGVGATWQDLVTFTAVRGAQTAQRIEVTGTVNRWLRVIASGFGNTSPSSSASASTSPSLSASPSSSPSRSPSASLSPSTSTSRSPSASISPSASASISPSSSTSISPSSSLSASTSLSQSASASPTAGAGPASSIQLFVGFARG